MIHLQEFIHNFLSTFATSRLPWEIVADLQLMIEDKLKMLSNDYNIADGVAIHKTAVVEQGVIIKAPAIIEANCFIGANAYLRGGVYLGRASKIGTSCEVKTSIIMENSGVAHFNFIGDSIIGNSVNFEAGSITANHFNEREEKGISVYHNSQIIKTGAIKFGALVGDFSKIGANAVLSPGTILNPKSIVARLELVDQTK
jgi:UDP-N-acetylglucosamine diphosphorylase / glucose-1-phosphate thymidylyltransferase / UDP-N-acetylgalactosamine diphosphorylase / glucosamine-1-phosphate N-acetyltransferase / galactosamine-1-phosphate N-acetyltransferase